MKTKFNKDWNRSVQPRKQVKFRTNAPNHILRKFMAANLDKKLREKYGRRSIEVIKNDEVKIMRGKYKGKQGKVTDCDVKNSRIQVESISKTRKTGDKVAVWFNPSNVKIITLNDKDAKRFKKKQNKEKKDSVEKVEDKKVNKEKKNA
jgi:large subunit ribosomal protein L24